MYDKIRDTVRIYAELTVFGDVPFQGPGSMGRRGSQQGRGGKEVKQRVIEIPVAAPVELHKAEVSWVKQAREKKALVGDNIDTEVRISLV